MNKGIKFFGLLSLIIVSFGFISNNYNKIIDETGISDLIINISTLKDIKKVFPNGTTDVRKSKMQMYGHAKLTTGECVEIKGKKRKVKYIKYIDEKNGLIFNLGNDDRLKTISFIKPTKYQTNKGIRAGHNSFSELDLLYGEKTWSRHITGNCKIHGDLIFFPSDSIAQSDLTIDELNNLKTIDLTIEKIVLFKSKIENK